MAAPADAQAAALLAHVVSQMRQNIEFLVSQNYITAADASLMTARLPCATGPVSAAVAPALTKAPRAVPPPPAARPVIGKAKALWPYNEDAQDPSDLTFHPGDIIEIVEETNDDWWIGRVRGREGLFPTNHVARVDTPALPARAVPPAPRGSTEKPAYKPFMAAHHGADVPPPGGATNSLGLAQDPKQEAKKSKFGKYGNTMAHSAAGGVGFGAGAAIGGGLVRAIF
ncbi:SH3-domain-containing protein [Gloeophyllum trabeum ATCC 11539]|uniref:SH3-domain-containing protein n=1 Tax=Gloeophyllum trabeum (strain ATCC 11539 / FP-39264 / Madison 617) TaxID=670483 RepID=S7RIX6_GLOTA|nr:SH3-domain-containing protein [Gloeophyllum trabeum ATCC 11539]EPQ54310.1 SH3-domain-containing protein [Gloeophyllum trabeum ATCC 11539]